MPRKSLVKNVKRPPSGVLWDTTKHIRASQQLEVDLMTNYLRNSKNTTKSTIEDHERIKGVLLAMRFNAALMEMPLWKFLDIIVSYGFAEWLRSNGDKMKVFAERERIKADNVAKILEVQDEVREQRIDELTSMAEYMTEVANINKEERLAGRSA